MSAIPPLPPTGIQRQAATQPGGGAQSIGQGGSVNPANQRPGQQPGQQQPAPGAQGGGQMAMPASLGSTSPSAPPSQRGATSLSQLANQLATQYGIPLGQNGLVDEQGNFLQTPDQVAQESGGKIGMGAAAARMNLIADAIQRQQQERQQAKSVSALQAGLGQVQQRGRGSLAALQSGYYQDLAQTYSSQQYKADDFSYFIQQDLLNQQQDMMRKQQKKAKWSASLGAIGGIVGTIFGGPGGGAIGASTGQAAGSWF